MNKSIIIPLFLIIIYSKNLMAVFLPDNDLHLKSLKSNNMTEQEFNQAIESFENIYRPIIKKKGGKLVIQKMWSANEVNASARRFYPLYSITIMGGLARHPYMTIDSLTLTLCHEMGHLLGSAPRKSNIVNKWASVEGQSDYFASLKCLRRAWTKDDNERLIEGRHVPPVLENECLKSFSDENKAAICIRTGLASLSVARLMASIREDGPVSISTPDQTIVSKTLQDHPASQCRLDTLFQGALCPVEYKKGLSKRNPNQGSCNRKENYMVGLRPLCWYKP